MTEREYDQIHNEGGQGYNPYRQERLEREANQPRVRTAYDVARDLEREDCSIARESGTYDADRVAALRNEFEMLSTAEEHARLVTAGWTDAVTTQARREAWNNAVRAGQIAPNTLARDQQRIGYTLADLKNAIKFYGLA